MAPRRGAVSTACSVSNQKPLKRLNYLAFAIHRAEAAVLMRTNILMFYPPYSRRSVQML